MNYSKTYTIFTIFSILIIENHGGLLDTVFGTVKNTTSEVTSGVGNFLSFGKDLVTGKHRHTGNDVAVQKKGIVTGFIDSVHQSVHDVHQKIRNVLVGEEKNDKGIIGKVVDRMKHKIAKATEFFTGGSEKRKEMIDHSRDEVKVAYQNLNTLIFGNETHKHGSKLRELIKNLKDNIKSSIHRNDTRTPAPDNENTDGSGLIDIRIASDDLANNLDEDIAKTKSRFSEGINDVNNNLARNKNYIENSAKDALDRQKKLTETGRKKIDEDALVFRD